MNMMNFLRTRKSTREFKSKNLNENDYKKISEIINEINFEAQQYLIKMKLYEFGSNIYENLKGIAGYAGVMIKSPHYIALENEIDRKESLIYSGYYMEKLITELNNLGIGTCWVSLKEVNSEIKEQVFGEGAKKVNYLLAIGYPKPKSPFAHDSFSERLGEEEIVYLNDIGRNATLEELESRGLGDLFFYVRFAPSTMNKQPWRFVLHDDYVELLMVDDGNIDYVDAGIIMYYFEELAKIEGLKNKWELILEPLENKNEKYMLIGKYKI
ncbi:MAG: nitroreductase [Tissierellales bacterium]|nr:nitroreductase [Tissierellales bacterium]